MSKCIKDFRGYVKHWIIDKNSFVYDFVDYEKDEYNGRCYILVESCNLRPEMDGALVRKRISNKAYEEAFKKAKEITES